MNSISTKAPSSDRYVTLRFCRWLCGPPRLRILLGVLACLGTLVAAFYAFENWRGRRAWTRMQRQLQESGQWAEFTALIPPPVPDDQNFAMTPVLAPLLDFEPGTQKHRDTNAVARIRELGKTVNSGSSKWEGWRLGQSTDWSEVLAAKATTNSVALTPAVVLEALRAEEPFLAELRTASARPHARFNIRYDLEDPTAMLLPHLSVLNAANRVLSVRASAQLALGRTDAALADIELGFYLIETIRQEPVLISYLVRCAGLNRLIQPVWEGLREKAWSEPQLLALQTLLQRCHFWADAQTALTAERIVCGNRIIEVVRRRPTMLGKLGSIEGSEGGSSDFLVALFPRGWFYLEQVEYHRLFTASLGPTAMPRSESVDPAQVEAASGRLDDVLRQRRSPFSHHLLSSMLLPALGKRGEEGGRRAGLRGPGDARLCARRATGCRGGTLSRGPPGPRSEVPYRRPSRCHPRRALALSVDPQRRLPPLSVGWNATDDGGVPGRNEKGRSDSATGDWVWALQ